jgi:hypothetical protein
MAKANKGVDLGVLQNDVEAASRLFKTARTNAINARQAEVKAEQAYDVAQKAMAAGVEQVKAATKV